MRQVAEEEVMAFAATRQGGLRLCGLRLHWPRSPLRGFCCADMGSASYCLQEGYFGAKSWARISHTWRQPLDLGPVGQDDERETRDARASYDYGCPVQATDVEGLTLSRDPEDLGPSRPRRPRPQAGAPKRPGAASACSACRRFGRNHVSAEPGSFRFAVARRRGLRRKSGKGSAPEPVRERVPRAAGAGAQVVGTDFFRSR